jgi:hypothetical protein
MKEGALKMILGEENQKYAENNLSQCHFASHMD